ncbi:MAG: gluconate 2-dehydrogenase subunit 3 family protein [Pseudomonadota bacterium]
MDLPKGMQTGAHNLTRRRLLAASVLAVPAWATAVRFAGAQTLDMLETRLIAFSDVILPRDDTPSASDLGSHRRILSRAADDERFAGIVEAALDLLDRVSDQRHGKPFVALGDEARHDIIAEMAEAPEDTLPGWFFRAARAELFMDYYARPESWAGLGLEDPPQPAGYLDASEAPEGRT